MLHRIVSIVASAALWLAVPLVTAAAGPDWNSVAETETVTVVTTNEDESPRETTVWLAVVDGQGFIRTGRTRWGANAERDPNVTLRVAGAEHPLRVEFVADDALRERVTQALRAKYGWSDRLLSPFRGRRPKIMRLVPREPET